MSGPTGPPSAGGAGSYTAQGQHGNATGGSTTATGGAVAATSSPADLNKIVTDYLLKKGFTKTEATFRKESAGNDGRPQHKTTNEMGPERYRKAFDLLSKWIENGLVLYKFELGKLLWPVFVYSFFEMVSQGSDREARGFLEALQKDFESVHGDELKILAAITLPPHLVENDVAKIYLDNKYRIPLNQFVSGQLFSFLERESESGGDVITGILQKHCQIDSTARGPIEPYSFEAIYRRTQDPEADDIYGQQEGIPGVFTGVNNRDGVNAHAALKLGPMPMDAELRGDVRAELEEEDQIHPPVEGVPTLLDEFDRKIKREDSADGPSRNDIPLPPSRARDVIMEMQKVRENRDRFKIEGRTGGVGVPITICMFTFHNTCGSVSSMAFSKDNELVATGFMDSYIRVWTIDGTPMKNDAPNGEKTNNRKLIGHSGPVYDLSFSDGIAKLDRNIYSEGGEPDPSTNSKLLLSSSADGTIRLWSLEHWVCLCIYKAHHGPVTRVSWGPHGHYFMTGGWDRTVRIFMQDHASAQRILVGHDTSISAIAWHPNGAYVFSASDETDKSIRMWSVQKGECVRIFTGHTDYISSLECAPNGKMLASADIGGSICLWDIEKGTRIKRCRGHGKGGITSMSFSVESTVLVSGGLDGTVRLWDIDLPKDASKAAALGGPAMAAPQPPQPDGTGVVGDSVTVGGGGARDPSNITVGGGQQAPAPSAAAGGGTGTGTGKKKGKEVMVTPDQISAFATKKTPVLRVAMTRMNLVVAGGCFEP